MYLTFRDKDTTRGAKKQLFLTKRAAPSIMCLRHKPTTGRSESTMTKALISVTGLDATGIIAKVATKLSEMNINILDITQTILGGYFTMMMVVDLDGAHRKFAEIDSELDSVRQELNMTIHMQRMDIFDAMHRV